MANTRKAPEDRIISISTVMAFAFGLLALAFAGGMSGCSSKKKAEAKPVAAKTSAPEIAKGLPAQTTGDLLGTVRFDFDRADLSEEAKTLLRDAAKGLDEPVVVRIEGHADERGSTEYNLALSEKRAAAVVRYLSDLGVPASKLSTVAYGEEKPADAVDHAKNRRAELRVVERRRVSKN